MSHDGDNSWFDAHGVFGLWHNTSETMDNYDKCNKPPNICNVVGINNESTNEHVEPDFYIGERQT